VSEIKWNITASLFNSAFDRKIKEETFIKQRNIINNRVN